MFNINTFLEKFKNLTPPDKDIKTATIDSIKKTTGIIIKEKDVSVRPGVVYIKEKPLYKNEIFIQKKQILDDLKNKLKNKTPKDIR